MPFLTNFFRKDIILTAHTVYEPLKRSKDEFCNLQ